MNGVPALSMPALSSEALSNFRVGQARQLAETARLSSQEEGLRKVSREFESLFLNLMLKEMRNTVPQFDPLHSYAEETYREMLDREWTRQMVQERSIGLAEMVYRQLSSMETPRER